jgi:hypothetical protein
MSVRPTQEKLPSQENLLLEYAQRLSRHREDRRAVHIHLSRLQPYNRRAQHMRIAANSFESVVKSFDGQLFFLANADIVFVCKGANVSVIDDAVMRLRFLFNDDPITQETVEGTDRFCSWYDLARDYDRFLAAVQAVHEEEAKRARRLSAITGPEIEVRPDRAPLDPHRLGELVDSIIRADLSNMMRRQAICAIASGAAPQPIFRELYISIADLRDFIMPGTDIASDRWLFLHLTQTLDKRMLKLMMKNDDRELSSAFSINLNVATLTSAEFLAFDKSLKSGVRGTIVIEVQLVDVIADLRGFFFARDFVKERGYRICLDAITEMSLPFVDRERLGVDLVKLAWQPGMIDRYRGTSAELTTGIERLGKMRTILCHCDTVEAIEFGQTIGVNLFQGRHVEKLLSAGRSDARVGLNRLRAAVPAR